MNHIFQTSVLLNYMTIGYIEINWLSKHRKKVRGSQASISLNLVLNWVKQFFLWVLLLKDNPPRIFWIFRITNWVIQFCWNLLTFLKIYMEWIFQKKFFGIARICGPGTNFSTGGRIKILTDFKFPQMYMYYISLDCKLSIEHDFFSIKSVFLCIQNAKIFHT